MPGGQLVNFNFGRLGPVYNGMAAAGTAAAGLLSNRDVADVLLRELQKAARNQLMSNAQPISEWMVRQGANVIRQITGGGGGGSGGPNLPRIGWAQGPGGGRKRRRMIVTDPSGPQALGSLMTGDSKYYDSGTSKVFTQGFSATASSAWYLSEAINGPSVGTGDEQRIGRKIQVTGFDISVTLSALYLLGTSAGAVKPQLGRLSLP